MAINYQGGNDAVITQYLQPIVNTIQNNYLMDQKIRQKEREQTQELQKDILNDYSKLNVDGLRPADLPELTRLTEQWKDDFHKLRQAKTQPERTELSLKITQDISAIKAHVEGSKEVQKRRLTASQTNANQLTGGRGRLEEYTSHVKASDELPWNKIGADYYSSASYVNPYDESKINTAITQSLSKALDNPSIAQISDPIQQAYSTSAGRRNTITRTASLPAEQTFTLISNLANKEGDVKRYVDFQVASGANRDEVIQDLMVTYQPYTTKEISRTDVSGERRQPTTININNVPPAIQQTPRTVTVGTFTSPNTRTFNEKVGIQGRSPIYDANTGNQITVARSAFQFQGYNIQELPVDSKGNPLPTNEDGKVKQPSKVAGTKTFLTGTIIDPNLSVGEGALSPQAQAALSSDVIIPYEVSDFINMGKSQRESVFGLGRQGTTTNTRNSGSNSVSSGQQNTRRGILD